MLDEAGVLGVHVGQAALALHLDRAPVVQRVTGQGTGLVVGAASTGPGEGESAPIVGRVGVQAPKTKRVLNFHPRVRERAPRTRP